MFVLGLSYIGLGVFLVIILLRESFIIIFFNVEKFSCRYGEETKELFRCRVRIGLC